MRRTADDFAAEMATRKAAHVNDGLMDLGVAIDTAVDELIDQNRREQQHGLSQHNPSSPTSSAPHKRPHIA